LPLVQCLCCQVEVSASGWSLVQRSPTECGVWMWSNEKYTTSTRTGSGQKKYGIRIIIRIMWAIENGVEETRSAQILLKRKRLPYVNIHHGDVWDTIDVSPRIINLGNRTCRFTVDFIRSGLPGIVPILGGGGF
jgi:hypothetical protein